MKALYGFASLLLVVSAWAQTSIEKAPPPLPKSPPAESGKVPDPGLSNLPDASAGSSGDSPANAGIVKVPPSTGTENITKPPQNVDPGISAPTDDIDRKNKENAERQKQLK